MAPVRSFTHPKKSHFLNFNHVAVTLFISSNIRMISSLDNGLARTPPMGWSTYLAYDCKPCNNLYVDVDCMSENNIRDIADQLVAQGFATLGYQYIILDDCWQKKERDPYGWLDADPQRFPSTIPSLAKYIHDRNLKLGMFSDLGPYSGQLFPGSEGYFIQDSATFAQWQVDYVKMSGASANPYYMSWGYSNFGLYLASTGRPMIYATSWPVYQYFNRLNVDYAEVSRYCNTWRFAGDAAANWTTILGIMDFYGMIQPEMTKDVHPGAWADADLLVIGVEGVTEDQSKAQMAIWSIMPSPLIFSVNLRTLNSRFKSILQNKDVIAVNQDPLGKPGYKFGQDGYIDIWKRPIRPSNGNEYSFAIAFVYRIQSSLPIPYSVTLKDLELNNPSGYYITDLFPNGNFLSYNRQLMLPASVLEMRINPQGVAFFKAELANAVSTGPSPPLLFPTNNVAVSYNPLPAPTTGIIRYNI